ncbi:acyl-CoA dehydrogenase family protein [Actinophytocola sp.]|uniref:acyl-CoA dehydrogenase family protein n=1 Tax=Actinophytocola sp. TaxID=1872138 RepID=UPI003D6A60EE
MIDDSELRLLAESVRRAVQPLEAGSPVRPEPGEFWRAAGAAGWTGGDLPATAVYTIARELGAGGIFGVYADSVPLASVLSGHTADPRVAAVTAELAAGEAQVAFVDGARLPERRELVRPSWPAPAKRYGAIVRPGRLDLVTLTGGEPLTTSAAEPADAVPADAEVVTCSVAVADEVLERARLMRDLVACAQLTGAHRYLLGLTCDFATTRVQFGRPIVEFQGLRHVLVDVFSWLEAAELLLAEAFATADRTGELPERSRAAVVFVRGRAWWALQRAYEVLGGVGFMTEHPLNHYTREMLVSLAAIGSQDSHAETMAELIRPRGWLRAS